MLKIKKRNKNRKNYNPIIEKFEIISKNCNLINSLLDFVKIQVKILNDNLKKTTESNLDNIHRKVEEHNKFDLPN
ncbi:MAG: hypothetical protein ACFFCV_13450 [Promethearchaeota archaeon]